MGYKEHVQQREYVARKERIIKGVSENSWMPLLCTTGKLGLLKT